MNVLAMGLPSWLAISIGWIVLITIVALLAYFLWSTLFLWLGTKVACVEKTTFGRALKCNAIIWLLTGLLGVAFLAVLWFQIGAVPQRTPLIVLIAGGLAAVGYAAITISFIMSGFEISFWKSIGVWASTIGLNVLVIGAVQLVLWVAIQGPVAYFQPEWLTTKISAASDAAAPAAVPASPAPSAAKARGTEAATAGARAAARSALAAKATAKATTSRAAPDRASVAGRPDTARSLPAS